MKKIILLMISITLVGACSDAQNGNFKDFSSYFQDGQLPFVIDNFNIPKGKIVPSYLALTYICKGDSSLLTFENIGINQDTREVVYKKQVPYQYKAYVKYQLGNYYIFIYDGYVKDGYHEFTSIINIGLYNQRGSLLDLMPFYIFDDTGKLKEQTGHIQNDFRILIKKKEYIKNEKGVFTHSYKEITETYEVEKNIGKFIKTGESVMVVDKSK
jgi:hypothetical protein